MCVYEEKLSVCLCSCVETLAMKSLLFILFLVKCFPGSHAVDKIQEFFIGAVGTSWDYLNPGGVDPVANQRYTHNTHIFYMKTHSIFSLLNS